MENVSFAFFSRNDYVGATLENGATFDDASSSVSLDGKSAYISLPPFLIGGEVEFINITLCTNRLFL